MKYKNAAEILPPYLLQELQKYINGDILYVPKTGSKKEWGTKNGSRFYYLERNREMKDLFRNGMSIDMLSKQYGLAYNTIKKIIYHK